jgi:hypothetical protein
MKNETPTKCFLLSVALAGFLLLPASSFAQQKQDDQANAKKTITIHVTKEVDGNMVVIDTTIVTEGDFDADAFLEEKGVLNDTDETGENVEKRIIIRHPGSQDFTWNESDDNSSGKGKNVEKRIIIRHPDSKDFTWNETEGKTTDTINIGDDQVFVFNEDFNMHAPPPPHKGMHYYKFNSPEDFHSMRGPQFEDMMQGMLRTMGLENVMPFGEMKQVIVKKKRNGKKIIITFEDRTKEEIEKDQKNIQEGNIIIYNNREQSSMPQNEEHIIIRKAPGEKVIMNEDVEVTAPVRKEIKVTVIEEDKK